MDARIKLGFPIKTEDIVREKPKSILKKIFRLKPARKKIGLKEFYADGQVKVKYDLGGVVPTLAKEECYNLTACELEKLLKEYNDNKRIELEKIKSF